MKLRAIYEHLCPNCGNSITDRRLSLGCVCSRCLEKPVGVSGLREVELVYNLLKANKRLKAYREIYDLLREVSEAEHYFKLCFGYPPWSAQRTWLKRLLANRSFSITASTGMGKTTFGIFAAYYLATKGKKSYLIFPTTILVKQAKERLEELATKRKEEIRVVAYIGKQREKEEAKKAMESLEFDVLLTTSQFLARNFDLLEGKTFDFVFVDDVDALLKSSRNAERVLLLLGFTQADLELVRRYLDARKKRNRRLEELREKLEERRRSVKHGCLIVASATGRARRGRATSLYRELLDFEVGATKDVLRNLYDAYIERCDEATLVKLVKRLGKGGLIFVPVRAGMELAEHLAEVLRRNGINAEAAHSRRKEVVDEFARENLDVLVGVANYYGILVRGLDLPHLIRYVIFYGVPRLEFHFSLGRIGISELMALLRILLDCLEGEECERAERLYFLLRRHLLRMGSNERELLEKRISERIAKTEVEARFLEAIDFVEKVLESESATQLLQRYKYALFEKEGDRIKVAIPDVKTYIQASGRASRLFAGGITRGLSVVLVDEQRCFAGLQRGLKWRYEEAEFSRLEELDLERILREIDEDRALVKGLIEGKRMGMRKDLLKSALMVVESPNKAKTIANFFGRPARRRLGRTIAYEVNTGEYMLTIVATLGHIYDLVTQRELDGVLVSPRAFIPIYDSIKRCKKCGEQFVDHASCPNCGSEDIIDKAEVVRAIQRLAIEVDEVFLATDPDIEGEKIAYDVYLALRPFVSKISRTEFHEVTRSAIERAIKERRELNEALVEAQLVRRIEDRWLGFGLSRFLWKIFENTKLSAGRVQTPVLGWVIERERQHKQSYADFTVIELENGMRLTLKGKIVASEAIVTNVKLEEKELLPPKPFTTDTLLQEAARRFRFSSAYAMALAQDLFELALITYHRTDSTQVSNVGISIAKSWIEESLGKEYFSPRKFTGRGAHECIRPTRSIDVRRLWLLIKEGIIVPVKAITKDHLKLYDLIFRRFMASQTRPAKVLWEEVELRVGDVVTKLSGAVEIRFPGWTKLVEAVTTIPLLRKGERVKIVRKRYFRAAEVKLFDEGEVIATMKERGIGRPSTYAKIVTTLFERKYVFKTRKGLVPTRLGKSVYFQLKKHYPNLVSEERTRELEQRMLLVEEGKTDYQAVLRNLYQELKSSGLLALGKFKASV